MRNIVEGCHGATHDDEFPDGVECGERIAVPESVGPHEDSSLGSDVGNRRRSFIGNMSEDIEALGLGWHHG